MVLISFEDLYKIYNFPKFHRRGSKIVPATHIWSFNFKRVWQAQFLSHTYETLEKYVSFIDLEIMLVPFFEIHHGVWDKDFVHSCHIHILSHPCLIIFHICITIFPCFFDFLVYMQTLDCLKVNIRLYTKLKLQ